MHAFGACSLCEQSCSARTAAAGCRRERRVGWDLRPSLILSLGQFHSVAGSPKPLAAELLAARSGSGRPHYALLAVLTPRCISTSAALFAEAQVQAPPVVPAASAPAAVPEVASAGPADVVQCATEQSFAELGLGSYTPVGLIQNLLEYIHVDLGLPWWGAIATCKSTS